MSGDTSLEDFEKGLQDILGAFKSATLCLKATESIRKIREDVKKLMQSAEIDFNDSDFQEYRKHLGLCYGMLIGLEQPGKALESRAEVLRNVLQKVVKDKTFRSDDAESTKSLLEEMLDMVKDMDRKIGEFVNGMKQVREHCEKAIKSAEAEQEKVQNAKAPYTKDIVLGLPVSVLGSAALALGIAGIVTGGAAFVAAGVAAAAVGGAVIAGGATLTTVGALSRQELDQKAKIFHDALTTLKVAMETLRAMEKNTTKEIVTPTAEMIKNLEVGLALYGSIVENAKENERLKEENSAQAEEIKELKRRLEEIGETKQRHVTEATVGCQD